MKNKNFLLLICTTSILITSCQKEVDFQDLTNPGGGGNPNNSILGKWNFVGMTADIKSTIMAGSGINEEKAVSSYGFVSYNNKGTVTIDASKFTSVGIAYSLDTVVKTDLYLGGVLFDSFETDFQMDMPPSSGSVNYKAIGSDSIYFASGFITLDPSAGAGGPQATIPTGSRLSWLSDTLVLKTIVAESRTQSINGIDTKVTNNVLQIVKLKK
jgi:hypothetical protein